MEEPAKFSVVPHVFSDFLVTFNLPLAYMVMDVLEKHINAVEANGERVPTPLHAFYEQLDHRADYLENRVKVG